MKHKTQLTIKKTKKRLVVIVIVWLILTILLIAPIAHAIADGYQDGKFIIDNFMNGLVASISNPFKTIGEVFTDKYFSTFISTLWRVTLVYIVIAVIGIIKGSAKHEFEEIEYGSSDWCENGEQYKVLSNNKGILLAERHYLPLDKPGNTNVLVVGRIRFW